MHSYEFWGLWHPLGGDGRDDSRQSEYKQHQKFLRVIEIQLTWFSGDQ